MKDADKERAALDAYLGKNIRLEAPTSSLMKSTSEWLNHPIIREVLPIWLLRKNGPDFPVEADHTLGLSKAFDDVVPSARLAELLEEERRINPEFDAWVAEGFVSNYDNEHFNQYAPGTGAHDRLSDPRARLRPDAGRGQPGAGEHVHARILEDSRPPEPRLRTHPDRRPVQLAGRGGDHLRRVANQARHLSPELAGAVNPTRPSRACAW